ncbi:MAG: RdgB/HAM1 family non-canonical purine NTP pyrophosphatase [Rhodothermales bacterium]
MKILLATRNAGKVSEMRSLLSDLPVELISALDLDDPPDVEEDADTLEGNARKKADVLHAYSGLPALADDTGLEVDRLEGRPGVRSARYAGPKADDAANRRKLLDELDGAGDRAARFRTVIAFVDRAGVHQFEGICRGRIIDEERGTGGFGYDSIFVPEDADRTFAELSADEKNEVSHRGRALRLLADYLRDRLE